MNIDITIYIFLVIIMRQLGDTIFFHEICSFENNQNLIFEIDNSTLFRRKKDG